MTDRTEAEIRNAALEEAANLIETTNETTTVVDAGDTQRHLTPRKGIGNMNGLAWAAGIRALKSAPAAQAPANGADVALPPMPDLQFKMFYRSDVLAELEAYARAAVLAAAERRLQVRQRLVRAAGRSGTAGDAQPVLYTTEFDGHLQTSTHGTQAEAETFARNVNALRRMDRGACVVVPLYRDAPVAAQKADDDGPTCPICGCPGGRHSGGSTCTNAAFAQQRKGEV